MQTSLAAGSGSVHLGGLRCFTYTPYFRVFNPVLQVEKFDPDGGYVRRWVPELSALPDRWLHRPWAAPAGVLDQAGLELGRDYPVPIVDLKTSRERALASFAAIKH